MRGCELNYESLKWIAFAYMPACKVSGHQNRGKSLGGCSSVGQRLRLTIPDSGASWQRLNF